MQWLQCQPILALWGPPMLGKTTICKYALILAGLDNIQTIIQGTEAGLTAAASVAKGLPMVCDDMPWNEKVRAAKASLILMLCLHPNHDD